MQPSLSPLLDLEQLALPSLPKVEAIEWYPFTDSQGYPAYWITVILADDTLPQQRTRSLTRAIESRIRDALREANVEEFPYIRTVTRADLKEAEEAD